MRRILLALSVSTSFGCEANGPPYASEPEFTHDIDIQPIWTERCQPCHIDGGSFALLWLDEGDGFAHLVQVPAQQQPQMLLVDPGSPATSYLWRKLNGTHLEVGGYGEQVPVTLDATEMKMIETWILDGAPR